MPIYCHRTSWGVLEHFDGQLWFPAPAALASSMLAGGSVEKDQYLNTVVSYLNYSAADCRGPGEGKRLC